DRKRGDGRWRQWRYERRILSRRNRRVRRGQPDHRCPQPRQRESQTIGRTRKASCEIEVKIRANTHAPHVWPSNLEADLRLPDARSERATRLDRSISEDK